MKNLLFCLILCLFANVTVAQNTKEIEAQAAFHYILHEVEQDEKLTFEERKEKVEAFTLFAENLSSKVASRLTTLLLEETRSRILEILQNADLDAATIDFYLDNYEETICRVQNMTVEIARQMLFFVAELKIHRQYVHDFGVALGCPEKQLLQHDLCKLSVDQFEGYARYFRGGRKDEDKLAYLAACELHQHEEHHHECYSKEGFDFDNFPEDRLRNNMLESVADLLAATKQRGGTTLIDWLVNIFPKKNPHPRLIPFLEEGLKKAHAFYLENEDNPELNQLFKGLPCWNQEVEKVFEMMMSYHATT